jgi:RNA polymerase sigma-70 factor (ECF subfamily)
MQAAQPGDVLQSGQDDSHALEASTIQRVCAGEKNLFYELIRPYQRSVYLTTIAILRNEADAEDAAQETFLKAFRALSSFRGESRFSTWLERIAVNESRMRLRRRRTESIEPLEEEDSETRTYSPRMLTDWREIPSEALEVKEVREILARAILQLPEKYREIVVLRDIQNRSIIETAALLGLTPATVKTRLLRARLQLRDFLAPLLKNSVVSSRNFFRKGRNPW